MRFVLIIENTPDCVRANPMNGIIVEDFEPSTTTAAATAAAATAAAAADTTAGLSDPEEAAASPAESVEESPSRRRSVSGGREQKNASSLPTSATSASASTASATVAVDHTFRKLITLVTDLGNSGNTPVPEFLSSYPLLRRQRVVGSNGEAIPIFYLSSRRARRVPVPAAVASSAVTAATAGGSAEAVGAKAAADGSGPAVGSSAVAVAADDGFKVAKGGAGKVIKANRDKKTPPA